MLSTTVLQTSRGYNIRMWIAASLKKSIGTISTNLADSKSDLASFTIQRDVSLEQIPWQARQ